MNGIERGYYYLAYRLVNGALNDYKKKEDAYALLFLKNATSLLSFLGYEPYDAVSAAYRLRKYYLFRQDHNCKDCKYKCKYRKASYSPNRSETLWCRKHG